MKKIIIALIIAVPAFSFAGNEGIKIVAPNLSATDASNDNDLNYPKVLMAVEKRNHDALLSASLQSDPEDTHLKLKKNLIPIDHPIPAIPMNVDIIGYAAVGGWVNNNWTGLKTFYKTNNSVCEYENVKIQGATLPSNTFTRDINEKPTFITTYGDDEHGYLYSVSWLTENKDHSVMEQTINCARLGKSDTMQNALIELAKKIDLS